MNVQHDEESLRDQGLLGLVKCGAAKAKLSLTEREYHCTACGARIDRDVNAAINLARLGDPTGERGLPGHTRWLDVEALVRPCPDRLMPDWVRLGPAKRQPSPTFSGRRIHLGRCRDDWRHRQPSGTEFAEGGPVTRSPDQFDGRLSRMLDAG